MVVNEGDKTLGQTARITKFVISQQPGSQHCLCGRPFAKNGLPMDILDILVCCAEIHSLRALEFPTIRKATRNTKTLRPFMSLNNKSYPPPIRFSHKNLPYNFKRCK